VLDVEHAGCTTHGMVLLDLGAVGYRHLPTPKVNQPRAKRRMQIK